MSLARSSSLLAKTNPIPFIPLTLPKPNQTKPNQWGLIYTFAELVQNPTYALLTKPFAKSVPEIERLYQSLSAPQVEGAGGGLEGLMGGGSSN